MYMDDEKLLKRLAVERNLNKTTLYNYKHAIKLYTSFFNESLTSMLLEAETEEENRVRWKNRKIKQKLLLFERMLEKNYQKRTVKTVFSRIITIYRHFDIEINSLPVVNKKRLVEVAPIGFDDLPTSTIIKRALSVASPIMRAIILFSVSSGSARRETLNLQVQDFINATKDYHDSDNIYTVLECLKTCETVVPTFKLRRAKTNKFYYTFCTPEAVKSIIAYLVSVERPLTNDAPLFKISKDYYSREFKNINDKLVLGKKGNYSRFRSHMLRKFHASQLYKAGLTISEIDELQGRKKDSTHSSYFLEDPKTLKKKYIECMQAVSINQEVNYVNIKSDEYQRLEQELKQKTTELDGIKSRLGVIEELLSSEDYQKLIKKL